MILSGTPSKLRYEELWKYFPLNYFIKKPINIILIAKDPLDLEVTDTFKLKV